MRTALIRPLLVALLALVALVALAPAASAQAPYAGQRVRVTSGRLVAPLIGSFQGIERDSIVVLDEGMTAQRVAIAVTDVQRIEGFEGFEKGNRRNMLVWGAGGAVAGGIAGYLAAIIFQSASDADYDKVASAGIGAALGGGLGAYLGYRKVEEKWSRLQLSRRVGLVQDGRRVGLSIEF